jgi:phosphate transport system permease protein
VIRWISALATLCAVVPVLAFLLIVGSTIVQAAPALLQLGLQLLGPELATPFARSTNNVYGLLAPIWGSLELLALALVVALPSSLALALLIREFHVPLLTRCLGVVISTLAGIPPIVYAVMALFVMESFMRPKLSGWELDDLRIRAAVQGVPNYDQFALPAGMPNSTLLGGILLGLLVIPLTTPLIDDALRAVPANLKAGSYALGASHCYTLRRIVMPWALPGVLSAATLGALLATGELVIPYYIIGAASAVVRLPVPIWDVLERTPPLTSAGAGVLGGLSSEAEGVRALQVSVAYVAALLLLLVAIGIMLLDWSARRILMRKVAR